ncbi:MAG: Flp pilus assembly complex ATPase component TadA [Chromatiales bacterium]|nr:Flp pilus assembly complex ATPase component TadA [Gammaproteobacteria bacterium]MCP5351729.1 Flp pilus assembly complex ATPase component TadA [Chromatiales bacterium]
MTDSKRVDFPLAPMSVDDGADAVRVGDPVLVRDRAGGRHTGTLVGFDTGKKVVEIAQRGEISRFAFDDVKLLLLPSVRHWRPAMPSDSANSGALTTDGMRQDFRVTFKDGDQISGRSFGSRRDAAGCYFYPQQDEDRYRCLFVPQDAVSDAHGGPKLGEVLVQSHHVSEADVQRAVDTQVEVRRQRIGEYLTDKALVTRKELELAIERQRRTPTSKHLGDLLVDDGVISHGDLDEALRDQAQRRGRRLGQVLVDMGLVTPAEIQRAVARQLGFPSVDLKNFDIDPDVLALIPEEMARREHVMPLFRTGSRLAVAVEDPLDTGRMDTLRMLTNLFIDPVLAPLDQLDETIKHAYAMFDVDRGDEEFDVTEFGDSDEVTLPGSETESFVVRFAHKVVRDAISLRASDIHLEARRGRGGQLGAVIRLRRDGVLFPYRSIPVALHRSLLARFKVMADMDVADHRRPLDGKINFRRFSHLEQELRVVSVPVAGGQENMVLRLLSHGEPMALDRLGFSKRDLGVLRSAIAQPQGLVLVCGPTGSGKTTTLHSVLRELNRPGSKIWTAEDPVEISQPGLNQVQINTKAGLDFATAMRSFLRADPDIIMVGEMRDAETIGMAVEASLTGHLVLSTLHTNTAAGTVARLLDMGVDRFNFADSLHAVLAQRLVRRLCPKCRTERVLNDAEVRAMAVEYLAGLEVTESAEQHEARIRQWIEARAGDTGVVVHEAKGCASCSQTGYAERFGIYEMLLVSEVMRERILAGDTTAQLRRLAMAEGMRTLRQDGIDKVLAGETDLAEVRRVSVE